MSLYKDAESMLGDLDSALSDAKKSREKLTVAAGRVSVQAEKLTDLGRTINQAVEATADKQAALRALQTEIYESNRESLADSVEKQRILNTELRELVQAEIDRLEKNLKNSEERVMSSMKKGVLIISATVVLSLGLGATIAYIIFRA